MAPLRWKLLPLVLLTIPYGLLRVSNLAEAGTNSKPGIRQFVDQSKLPIELELSTLLDEPLAYLGQRVSFVVQFDAQVEKWNPLMSRFSHSQWGSFSAWSDDKFTWLQGAYEQPYARLYFPKSGLAERLVEHARRFERFQVTATVRELLLDEPYIEVEHLKPLFELIDEGTINHVSRGITFAKHGKLRLAKQQFERARTAPVPARARTEIERLIALCNK